MRHDDTQHRAEGLDSLDRLSDYKVADGFPDPRGWEVKGLDGQRIGKVEDLLVDRQAMRVKYLEVELDREFRRGDDDRVHVPVGAARLDDDHDDVFVDLASAGLGYLGAADATTGGATALDDAALAGGTVAGTTLPTGTAALTDDDRYDDRRFFGNRMAGRENDAYLTLHEEQLDVGTRRVQAGEVEVHKTVETERVHESVPVSHEEVTVERRPLAADAPIEGVQIGEDEIRVQVMREEIVTEKRVVPVEEVVIRKQAHTEQQVVEDTVRREVVDVDRDTVRDASRADTLRDGTLRDGTLRDDRTDRGL